MGADNNTPLGFSSYNNFDVSSFKDNPSLFEDSPYVRKLLDSTLSFDTKMAIAKQANLGKLAQLNGYRMGYILGADDEGAGVDPDSGLVQDAETGDTFRFRMKGASGNFDAVDNADVVAKSRNKRSYQPDYIAQITGKRVEDLTEFDFKNVKNYQTQEAFAAWKDPNHQFLPYNPNFVYEAPSAKQKIPVLYKSTGSGFYGRDLTDMINPATGRSMTFDAAANPYLNASFMLGDYEDNPRNRKRFEEFNALKAEAMKDRVSVGANTNDDALQDARDLAQIEHYKDNTNILKQAYDKFAYAGQLAKHSFVSEFTKFISSDRAKKMGSESVFDVKGWQALDKQLSREDQLNSRGAIFRQLNKEADKFYDNMQNEWGKGNYFASAKNALGFLANYVGMMPELIGQSAGQTGVGIGIGAAVGSAVAPGAGTVGGAMIGLAASVLGQGAYTALSNSLETLENYKKANNGKEMPWDETLQMFGEYLVAASYEAGLDRVFLGRLFGRSKLGQKMFGKPSKILEGKNSLQAGALAGLGEFPQEGWESTIDAYYSQKEGEGRQSRLELATSPEVVKQAVGGAVAGFGMGAGLTGLSKLGTGKASKLFRQRVEATQKANDTQTYTGVDADLDESHTFIAGLNSTTLDDKLHNLQQAVITPENAHARAENIRKQLNNPKSLLSRTAYDAGTIEANQWDLAAAQYYKDKGWSNDQIEKELGRSLKDIFGSVVHGSNLNTNKLYEQGLQLNEAQHAIEEETYTKIGKNLGLDEKFIRNTIEQTNNDARYGGSGYYTYRDRILDRLDRLRTESLTPESKAQYEDDIENNLTAMLRLYGDQARKIMTMTEGAEHLAATNDRQYETSWKFHDKGFVLHRTDLANNTYDADRGAYAIYRNALQDLKEIEKSFNSLLNAGLSKETEAKVRAWLGENDTNNPRAIPDWGIASTLEQRFKAAGLSLNQKAKNESKFKDKPFTTDDLVHSLTYISRVDPEQDKSAKYNQEFQNLHYAINQSPEVVQQLRDTVNGWKNKTAKEKALAALDKVISFRDTVNTNEEIRVKNHDPIVKDVTAQLDTIEKEYPNVYLEPGVDTSDTRQQKLVAQTKRYNTLMDLRNKLQSVIDNNNKDDLALRERLNNTVKELRKNMTSLASGKQNQSTGEQGKFAAAKEFLKNFTASIKRRVDKTGLERELKKLQKKYDDSVAKGHSKEIVDRIQSQITVVQDRLAELNKPAEQPKPNPNPTPDSNSNPTSEAKPESEEVSEPDDPLTKQVKRSTDIAWLNELKSNLEFSNKNNPNQANFIKLIDQRIETLNNAKVSSKASKLDESYDYGESDDIRRTTLYGTIASNLTKHKALKGKIKTAWIPYLLSNNIRDLLLSKETPAVKASIERVVKPAKELADKLSSKDLSTVIKNILRGSIVAAIKNLQAQYNKEYKAAYTQALQDLSNSPIFKLIAGEYGKIDYNSLVEHLGKEKAKELRKRIHKAIAKKGEKGSTLDVLASNPDNDIALIRSTFGENPDEIADSLYTKFVSEEATLKSEARSQALEAIKDLSEELHDLKIDPEGNAKAYIDDISKRLAEVSTLLQGRLDFMEGKDTEASKTFKAYAQILREDGSESTKRGGDGNSSTTPSGSDSTASQAPNSGNAPNTPSGASQSDQNGQGVQTPTSVPQGSQNGSQTPSQGSQASGTTEDEEADFIPASDMDNMSYSTISDDEMAEARRLFSKGKPKIIPNAYPKEMILELTRNKMEDTSEEGVGYLLNENRSLGDVSEQVSFKRTNNIGKEERIVKKEKRHIILRNQIKESNKDAECLLAYNYRLYSEQSSFDPNRKNIEIFREAANKVKFDPSQTADPKGTYYQLVDSNSPIDKNGNIDYRESMIRKSPAMLLLYDTILEFDKNGRLTNNPQFNFIDFVLTMADFSLREYLTNNDYERFFDGKYLDRTDLAKLFGENEDTLTAQDETDLREIVQGRYEEQPDGTVVQVREGGIPRSVMINGMGELMLRNMGIVENKESSNYGFFSSLTTSLGAWMLDYGEQLGLYHLGEVETRKGGILKAPKIAIVSVNENNLKAIKRTQTAFKGIITIPEDGSKPIRDNNGLNLFKNANSSLGNDLIWDGSNIRYTDRPVYVKNSGNLTEVSQFRKEVMETMANVKYSFDTDITDFLDEEIEDGKTGWDLLAKTMGYVDSNEFKYLSIDEQESVKGQNAAIEKQIEALKGGIRKQRKFIEAGVFRGIKFKQFWSKNGRIFIDSPNMNPQTMKLLRFTCLAEGMRYTYDPTLAKTDPIKFRELIQQENFAIAQAFDALGTAETTDRFSNAMKALSVEELKTLRKLLVSNSTKEFKNKIKELGKTSKHFANLEGIGVESVPQALNAITHLIRRREANGKAFTTSLVAENDSTTSGYVIKLLQFPMIEQMGGLDAFKELLEKVGVTLADGTLGDKNLLSIHELKKMKGFLDLYRTTAMAVSDYIDELQEKNNESKRIKVFTEAVGRDVKSTEDLNSEKLKEQNSDVAFLNHVFKEFKDALPKKDLKGKISSAFRELMKPATMVFGYSAGIESISRKLSETVMKDYVKVYTVLNLKYKGNIDNYIANEKPDHTKEEIEAIQKGMNAISRQYVPFNNGPKTFLEALQKFSYNKIVLTIGKNTDTPRAMSLDECFMHLIGDTYGQKAGEALEAIFEPYVKINNLMIEMSNTATDLYKRVYDSKVKELLKLAKEENREVSSTEMQKLKDELKELQPYLDLADDGYQIEQNGEIITNTSNMALTKFERDQGENNLGANYYIRDGKMVDGSFTYGNERTPGYPVRAGAVIPIHCLDGAIMADVLSQYGKNGLTGIHDAIVMSAFQSNEISRYYNQRLFQRCKDYSIFENMYDNFLRVYNNFNQSYGNLIDSPDGDINNMLVSNGKGGFTIKTSYMDWNTGEHVVIYKTISDLLEGYTLGKGSNKKTFEGVKEVSESVEKAREDFYKMNFVIANLDSSGIQGSFLSQEDGELVSQWNNNLRHANDKYNEDVTKTRTSLEAKEFLMDESEFFAQAFGKPELTDSEKASQVSSANNQEYVRGSGPRGYQTNGAIKNTYSRALESAEARVEALTDIQNLAKANGNRVCSNEQMARLQLLAGSIAPERVRGVALDVAENGRWSAGEYNALTKHIQVVMDDKSAKTFLDPKTKLCAFSLLAPAEIYVHELLHAANDFAFAHRGVFGFNSQIRKLLVLQDEARKVLTWEDFMPEVGTFDESVRKYYEQNAKEFYDYIFKEADPKTLDSLNEFCSFVATNENLRKKLQKVTINQPTLASKANLVDRVIAVLKNIYDVIFGRKKFSEAFMRSYKVLKGDSTGKTTSLLDEFDRLHRQLHTVTHKAVNPLLYHPLKIYETFLDITDSAIKTGNEKIHKALEGIFKYHDIRWEKAQEKVKQAQLKAKVAKQNGDTKAEQEAKDEEQEAIKEGAKHMPKYSLGTNVTKTDIIKLLGKLSKQVLTNGEARKQIRLALKELTKVSQQSVWMSTYRDFMGPDQGTATFEALGMKLRLVDKISKNQEATAMRVLQDSFGRPVTDYENTAIANSMLYTDLQCFYDGSNLSDIKELLRDTSVRKNLIQNTLAMFKQKLSARDYSWLQYSATSTAFNMIHGIGNPLLNLNAQGIADGKGWDHSLNLSDKEIESLDKLITLYALENTSQEYLDITASLPETGLEQFLKMHQEFVNESKNGYKDVLDNGFIDNKPFIEATSVMKGYVKTLTDPSIDSVIATPNPNDADEFKKQGYDDKMAIPADGIVNTKDTHVYTRFGIPNRRDGNVVSVQGHQAMGKTIMQFAFSIEDDINSVRTNPLDEATKKANALKRWKAMRKKADNQLIAIRNEVIDRSKQGKEFTFDDINKLINKYSSFSPIYDDKNAGPRDYRQTLARDIKRQHLGLDERGLTILSRMFGSVARQVYGQAVNEQLLQFTIDYMQDNMTFMGNYDKDGHKFIKIEKDSPNKYLRDSWKVVPPNFKEYIKHHDLYIREDWLQDYFGVPNYTLLDNEKIKKHTGYFIKRAIAIAEMVMKTIAYARKQAIVLKIPGVLVGNIISNLMFSIMNHRNPVKVIKTTIANAQAIRDYIENRKALDRILFKTRLGTVTKAETEQIPSLRRKLENNIVKPLMEKGMYQSIIEDMQSDELESIGKVNKWIKHNKILQKIPASLKTTFRTVFMMEGTPAYDFMFIATQYSDFIARCTEYQLSMDEVPAEYEKAKKDGTTKETFKQFNQRREQEISTEITNAFINYDKPQSQLEQYLNDLGLIMFSKFGKRIQSVIKNQMYRRPIHSILFLMSQLTFVDTEDILEQNMFNKKWLNLVHSPVENFIGAVVPMPLQIMFGDQKAF